MNSDGMEKMMMTMTMRRNKCMIRVVMQWNAWAVEHLGQ